MGEKYITLDEVCQMLSISKATGRNWLRLGKIESQRAMTDGKVYFTEDYVIELQRSLKTGKRNALRSRRNKGYVSGKGFYDRYVSEDCESTDVVKKLAGMLAEQNICVTETAMRALLSDCALKLLVDIPETNEILREYIDGRLDVGVWSILLDDIIQDKKEIETWISEHDDLLDISYKFQKGEDVLGLLYMSVRDIGVRKAAGSYFTPTEIVRNMIMDISQDLGGGLKGKKVLDPCCGTGNFLIQFSEDVDICNIHAFDTDMLSVQLARFNLALTRLAGRENVKAEGDIRTICENVVCRDFLAKSEDRISDTVNYDVIIGNPPWGYKFDIGSDDGLHLAVIGENGLFIKGLDGVEIHDRRADTLGLKQLHRLNGAGHHESGGEDRGIAAVADDVGLAGDERRIRVGDGVGIRTGQAQIDGAVYLHGRRNGLLGLLGVTGDEHGHAGDAAHEAYILKRLMGAAVLADAESRVSERELDVCLGIGDAVADLLICAACAEHGEGAGEGDIAGEGEARRRVYHVCLGDAEIIEPVGKSLFEGAGLCGAGEIRVHNDYALIGFAKLCKSFAVCFSCGFSHLTQPPILSWPPRSRRSL